MVDFTVTRSRIVFWFIVTYVVLFVCSFSFPHTFIPDFGYYGAIVLKPLAHWTASAVFGYGTNIVEYMASDTVLFYCNALNLIFIALLAALMLSYLVRYNATYVVLYSWFWVVFRYYLTMQLLVYGFNKVFKWQFYLPEPNTLFTSVGQSYKDILYWSSMGSSWWYSFFSGLIEVMAAVLLLFQRTALLGALLSLAIMLNVFMINIGFDISVKLYSLFLLLLSIVIVLPYAKRVWLFFTNQSVQNFPEAFKPELKLAPSIKMILKLAAFSLILADTLYTYVSSGNYNDDAAKRPVFHGAYNVDEFIVNDDTLKPLVTTPGRWRRVFIHSRGYFIVQTMDDKMTDFTWSHNETEQTWQIGSNNASSTLRYVKNSDTTLVLKGNIAGKKIQVNLTAIDLKTLPLLQEEFSWTIDGEK